MTAISSFSYLSDGILQLLFHVSLIAVIGVIVTLLIYYWGVPDDVDNWAVPKNKSLTRDDSFNCSPPQNKFNSLPPLTNVTFTSPKDPVFPSEDNLDVDFSDRLQNSYIFTNHSSFKSPCGAISELSGILNGDTDRVVNSCYDKISSTRKIKKLSVSELDLTQINKEQTHHRSLLDLSESDPSPTYVNGTVPLSKLRKKSIMATTHRKEPACLPDQPVSWDNKVQETDLPIYETLRDCVSGADPSEVCYMNTVSNGKLKGVNKEHLYENHKQWTSIYENEDPNADDYDPIYENVESAGCQGSQEVSVTEDAPLKPLAGAEGKSWEPLQVETKTDETCSLSSATSTLTPPSKLSPEINVPCSWSRCNTEEATPLPKDKSIPTKSVDKSKMDQQKGPVALGDIQAVLQEELAQRLQSIGKQKKIKKDRTSKPVKKAEKKAESGEVQGIEIFPDGSWDSHVAGEEKQSLPSSVHSAESDSSKDGIRKPSSLALGALRNRSTSGGVQSKAGSPGSPSKMSVETQETDYTGVESPAVESTPCDRVQGCQEDDITDGGTPRSPVIMKQDLEKVYLQIYSELEDDLAWVPTSPEPPVEEKTTAHYEEERLKVIHSQTVKMKRMDSWLKTQPQPAPAVPDSPELQSKLRYEERKRSRNSLSKTPDIKDEVQDGALDDVFPQPGEVDSASILLRKQQTKVYWESRMLAENEGKPLPGILKKNARNTLVHGLSKEEGPIEPPPGFTRESPVEHDAQNNDPSTLKQYIYGEDLAFSPVEFIDRGQCLDSDGVDVSVEISSVSSDKLVSHPLSVTPPATYYEESEPNVTEEKIAMEIREMREREEELRKRREKLAEAPNDSQFNSMTDDGDFSEYGSEDTKDISEDGSRLTTPEVPTHGGFRQHRTQSMESLSSGHSSGGSGSCSNGVSGIVTYPELYGKRKVTVKPLTEPTGEEETPCYLRVQSETPLEREIRLAKEREEELRQQRSVLGLQDFPSTQELERIAKPKQVPNKMSPVSCKSPIKISSMVGSPTNPTSFEYKIATNRIQQEIFEQAEREKALKDAGTIKTLSQDTVDSKLSQIETMFSEMNSSMDSSTSPKGTPEKFTSPHKTTVVDEDKRPHYVRSLSSPKITSLNGMRSQNSSPVRAAINKNVFRKMSAPHMGGRISLSNGQGTKGLMEKFIASRGSLGPMNAFAVPREEPMEKLPIQNGHVPNGTPPTRSLKKSISTCFTLDLGVPREAAKDPAEKSVIRRGLVTAEEKIQAELRDLKSREDELRKQRARVMARSQPDLLAVAEMDIGEIDFPSLSERCLSNPNLLDDDEEYSSSNNDHQAHIMNHVRRRTPLIAEWESRIQQSCNEG